MDTGFGKLVYARNFLNSLIPKMMRKSLTDPQVAEVIDLERLQKVTTIGKDCVRCRARLALSYVCTEVFRMVGVLAAYLETQDTTLSLNLTSNLLLRWAMLRSHVAWCVQLIDRRYRSGDGCGSRVFVCVRPSFFFLSTTLCQVQRTAVLPL